MAKERKEERGGRKGGVRKGREYGVRKERREMERTEKREEGRKGGIKKEGKVK